MNRKQAILAIVALALFAVSVFNAPYERITTSRSFGGGEGYISQRVIEYAPIWQPPGTYSYGDVNEYRLRWSSILLTWIAIGVSYVVLHLLLKASIFPKLKRQNSKQKNGEIVEIQVVEEKIVKCEACGFRNKIFSDNQTYRCGNCKEPLPQSEAARASKAVSPKRVVKLFLLVLGLILVALCITKIVLDNSSRSRNDNPLSDIGRARVFPQQAENPPSGKIPEFDPTKPYEEVAPPQIARIPVNKRGGEFDDLIPAKDSNRLSNGTLLKSFGQSGEGTITIENGTDKDALIKMIPNGATSSACIFCVTAGNSAIVSKVPDNNYTVYFALGLNWVDGRFTQSKSFGKFDKILDFKTYETTEGGAIYSNYSTFSLTLHKVPHGNVTTSTVNERKFDSL